MPESATKDDDTLKAATVDDGTFKRNTFKVLGLSPLFQAKSFTKTKYRSEFFASCGTPSAQPKGFQSMRGVPSSEPVPTAFSSPQKDNKCINGYVRTIRQTSSRHDTSFAKQYVGKQFTSHVQKTSVGGFSFNRSAIIN